MVPGISPSNLPFLSYVSDAVARKIGSLEPAERNPAQLRKTGLAIAAIMMIGGLLVTVAYRMKLNAEERDRRPHVVQRLTEVFFGRDQHNRAFSTDQLKGKVTFFTPISLGEEERMEQVLSLMVELSKKYSENENLRFVGFTIQGEKDGPEELQGLLEKLGVAGDERWLFVQAEEDSVRGYIRHKIRVEFEETISSLEGPVKRFRSTLVFIDENLHVLEPHFDLNAALEVQEDARRMLENDPDRAEKYKAGDRLDDYRKARERILEVFNFMLEGDLKEG